MTGIAVVVIDRLGRRPLLLGGVTGIVRVQSQRLINIYILYHDFFNADNMQIDLSLSLCVPPCFSLPPLSLSLCLSLFFFVSSLCLSFSQSLWLSVSLSSPLFIRICLRLLSNCLVDFQASLSLSLHTHRVFKNTKGL